MEQFDEWSQIWQPQLEIDYKEYLKDCLDEDNNFDITTVENYQEWLKEEYQIRLDKLRDIDYF